MFQNVAFVMRVIGVDIAVQQRKTFQVLKWVGLQHRMNAYPDELSGGEQQRIAIAHALVNEPQLVLPDEPTGNLDPDLSLEIMNLFREINARGSSRAVSRASCLRPEPVRRTISGAGALLCCSSRAARWWGALAGWLPRAAAPR